MSVTPGNLSLNGTSFFTENHSVVDKHSEQRTWNVFLFCLTFAIALPALLGSIYSLVSLLKLQNKSTVSVIVTSWAAGDLISIVPLIIFMLMQWSREVLPQALCTTSAFVYLFQGISTNLKGSLIVFYNFYTLSTSGTLSCSSSRRRVSVLWAILTIWTVSLLLCVLPLCGWGRYTRTPWGCFADCGSSYILLVLVVYALCLSLLAGLAVPLSLRLLCSGEPQLLHPQHLQGSAAFTSPGTPWGSAAPPLALLDPGEKSLEPLHNSEAVFGKGVAESSAHGRSCTVGFAQKRFSLILALTKVLLWLPMMTQVAVQHITGLQSLLFETLSFLLCLLNNSLLLWRENCLFPAGAGQFIPCFNTSFALCKRSGFEFNLSFQRGYGMYRISRENPPQPSSDGKSTSYHSLVSSDCEEPARGAGPGMLPMALGHGSWGTPGDTGPPNPPGAGPGLCQGQEGTKGEAAAFPEGPEWRLFHEESHTPELSDWEWCRSKSERNPRQRAALAVPLCAFQGTVSLQAPSGKTLSLSTYEVSSEGHKITPTAKKIEVYRSKSVGHEPGEPRAGFADTSVKIHLEVLEICGTEEALDTVSIVSSISQSSAQARSPSLRFSRRENRFVCCELGESASYSLLIPSHSPGSDFSISIPDTVEAHRQNSQRQLSAGAGHQEEIQLLNKAYMEREEQGGS
uniref:G protein-coupled receptor 149 n=1 Tax=Zosterops lateralis melanops TaxID=1220523 RepID=A0A8D2NYA1_ZOSLA